MKNQYSRCILNPHLPLPYRTNTLEIYDLLNIYNTLQYSDLLIASGTLHECELLDTPDTLNLSGLL